MITWFTNLVINSDRIFLSFDHHSYWTYRYIGISQSSDQSFYRMFIFLSMKLQNVSHRINQYRIEFFDYSKQFPIFYIYILLISLSLFFYLFEAFTNESNLHTLNILFLIFHYQFLYFRIINTGWFKKIRNNCQHLANYNKLYIFSTDKNDLDKRKIINNKTRINQ